MLSPIGVRVVSGDNEPDRDGFDNNGNGPPWLIKKMVNNAFKNKYSPFWILRKLPKSGAIKFITGYVTRR